MLNGIGNLVVIENLGDCRNLVCRGDRRGEGRSRREDDNRNHAGE
jgi:hypothetical protein